MGKIIAFFSPYRGVGTTTIMAAVGAATANNDRITVALTQLPGRIQNLEELFDENIIATNSREIYSKSGLWALWQTFRQGRLTNSDIRNCAVKTTKNTLDLFPYMPCGTATEKAQMAITALIMGDIKRAYDFCYIDLGDSNSDLARSVITGSDAVICILPQSERAWQKFMRQYSELMNTKKLFYLINGMLKDSASSISAFEHLFHKELYGRKPLAINVDSIIRDEASKGRINRIFSDQRKNAKKTSASETIKQIYKVVSLTTEAWDEYGGL